MCRIYCGSNTFRAISGNPIRPFIACTAYTPPRTLHQLLVRPYWLSPQAKLSLIVWPAISSVLHALFSHRTTLRISRTASNSHRMAYLPYTLYATFICPVHPSSTLYGLLPLLPLYSFSSTYTCRTLDTVRPTLLDTVRLDYLQHMTIISSPNRAFQLLVV